MPFWGGVRAAFDAQDGSPRSFIPFFEAGNKFAADPV